VEKPEGNAVLPAQRRARDVQKCRTRENVAFATKQKAQKRAARGFPRTAFFHQSENLCGK